ncbi:WD40-repeat-containing domain protein [Phycomyces nitens]|nr:WD40-repeat-containing domain protein [Phycomyces nitens]
MSAIDIVPRGAHEPGYTSLAYKEDGSEFISVGSDSTIRVFKTAPEERYVDPIEINYMTGTLETVAVHKDHFAASGEKGQVILADSNTNKILKPLFRSTVPVRCLAFNVSGTKLAVATDENTIRMVLLSDISRTVNIRGHTKGVKCIVFDPRGTLLLSLGCEGDLRVWDISPETSEPKCIKHYPSVMKPTLEDDTMNNVLAWSLDGTYFAAPGKDCDVVIYERTSWKQKGVLTGAHVEPVTCIAWSNVGDCIATSSADCQIIIWDANTLKVLTKYTVSMEPSCLAWSPVKNELSLADKYGQVLTVDDAGTVNPNIRGPPKKKGLFASENPTGIEEALEKLFNDEDGPDEEEDEDIDMMDLLDTADDFVVDDDGAGYTENDVEKVMVQKKLDPSRTRPEATRPRVDITPHPIIHPGETPFQKPGGHKNDDPEVGDRRYLAFDMFGVIYTIFHGAYSIVNVEFHDLTDHKNFHFRDYDHHSIAALGRKGAVFGSKSYKAEKDDDDDEDEDGDKKIASTVHYKPLDKGANRLEWSVPLPEGEEVETVAINDFSVVATTSAGLVRIFSLSGTQTHLFHLKNVVSLVASSDMLMLMYSPHQSTNNIHHIEYRLMNTDTFETMQTGTLPLNPKKTLAWAGFSESLQPAVGDSSGVVFILHQQRHAGQALWVPVFDGPATAARRERTERYWPIGLLREELMCLILRGKNMFPYFPRPQVNSVELMMPTTQLDTETGKLEEKFLRTKIISAHEKEEIRLEGGDENDIKKMDLEMDKTLLQLIQLACKAEKHDRVLDLSSALSSARSIDAAIKIASHFNLSRLAEHIIRIKESKFMDDSMFDGFSMQAHPGTQQFSAKRSSRDVDDDTLSSDSQIFPKRTRPM